MVQNMKVHTLSLKLSQAQTPRQRDLSMWHTYNPLRRESPNTCKLTFISNKDAVFQIASNFNAIESNSEETGPEYGNYATDYWKDKTQGPVASISAAGAALARVYMPFWRYGMSMENWQEYRQRRDRQVELLEDLAAHYPTKNGYVVWNGKEPILKEKHLQKYFLSNKIGYHKNVQVNNTTNEPPNFAAHVLITKLGSVRQSYSGSTRGEVPSSICQAAH